jgi:hypothetical protein
MEHAFDLNVSAVARRHAARDGWMAREGIKGYRSELGGELRVDKVQSCRA